MVRRELVGRDGQAEWKKGEGPGWGMLQGSNPFKGDQYQ